MREPTIARNYAEALLALARKADDLTGYGSMIHVLADAVQRDEQLRLFLETPKVSAAEKNAVLARAFQDRMPRLFVRFIQTLVSNRRQMLISQIAAEYATLVDEVEGRLHANVTVAREPGGDEQRVIAAQLSRALGKQVVPHFSVNPALLGGIVVRVGDTVMDGSVRRRLTLLRNRLAPAGGSRA
jgi:F-type H+-transporting ATPase subunit delta